MTIFNVNWSGKYPCLCHGAWTILKNEVNVSHYIPEDLRDEPMNTAGTYTEWYFDENWNEHDCQYTEGLEEAEWIAANPWITSICDSEEEKSMLYHAISVHDWRYGSCGGCI